MVIQAQHAAEQQQAGAALGAAAITPPSWAAGCAGSRRRSATPRSASSAAGFSARGYSRTRAVLTQTNPAAAPVTFRGAIQVDAVLMSAIGVDEIRSYAGVKQHQQ